MKILITGITGLFGSQLARSFSKVGHIHGLKRKTSSSDLLKDIDFEIQWHDGDILDPESIATALKGIDLVIHAAGFVSFDPNEKDDLYSINVNGTANLVNTMLAEGVHNLIHVSSVAAIGRSSEVLRINEKHKWTDSSLNTDYAISKYWGELEAWRGEQEGLNLIVVNPSVLLAKSDGGRSSTFIYNYLKDGRTFYPKGDLNYIDIRDAADMVLKIFEKGQWGERFILNRESLAYSEFFEVMGEVFELTPPKREISDWLLKWVIFFQNLLYRLKLTKAALNRQTAMIAQQKIFFDNKKVVKLLNYEFRSLRETFEWAK